MRRKIKNQTGFIQIPILIAIIAGILIIGAGGYFGVNNTEIIKITKEKIISLIIKK